VENGRPNPLPRENLGLHCQENSLLRQDNPTFPRLSSPSQEEIDQRFTSDMIINLIRDGVVGIGETKLGIERWEVGTHSI